MRFSELISRLARFLHKINDIDIVQTCGPAKGTGAHTLKTTRAIVYNLLNQQFTLAITDNIAMTVCALQASSTFCYYLVSVDSAGLVTVTKGTDNQYALPATPDWAIPIGAFLVTVDGSHTFTSGTDTPGTNNTTVFFDIDTGIAASLVNDCMRKLERGIVVPLNNQSVRISNFDHMRARVQVTLNAGDYLITNPFPTYKELIVAQIMDSNGFVWPSLTRAGFDNAMSLYPSFTQNKQRPVLISRVPAIQTSLTPETVDTVNFVLRPTADTTYTLDMQAYQYSPPLDGVIYSTNWWTENAPEVLLYGALMDAAPYLLNDERIAIWKSLYADAVAGLVSSQRLEKYAGSKLNIGFDNPLNRGYYDIYSDTYGGV